MEEKSPIPRADERNVKCPECGHVQRELCWPVTPNVFLPDVEESLLLGTLFEYECEACGYFDLLQYRCLYHDIPNRALILLEPPAGDEVEAWGLMDAHRRRQAGKDPGDRSVIVFRIVRHPDVLREKALILADGLDDRAVELIKASHRRLLAAGDELHALSGMYYAGMSEGGESLEFSVHGVEDGWLESNYGNYLLAKETVDRLFGDVEPATEGSELALLADSFDVDTSWAERLIDLIDGWGIVP